MPILLQKPFCIEQHNFSGPYARRSNKHLRDYIIPDKRTHGRGSRASQPTVPVELIANGTPHRLTLDPRVTLLDAMREHLNLTGSKKGCDHGQCGACTMIVNGRRIISCLTFAVM